MKQILFFLLALVSFQSFGQVIVDPKDFPSETSPGNSNFEFYSRKTGANRKASFDNVRKGMLPIVRQPADITYTPAPTGNSNDRGSIVRTAAGRVYYIDGLGNSQQLNLGIGSLTVADNDIHAGVMCVAVGGWYRLSSSNTLGLPAGDIRQRVYGSSTPCTNEGNSVSPGQTRVVGGAGILKVNGDPDTNPYVQRQDQYYEASVAWDTVARKIYTYNSAGTVGNRWDIFAGVSVDTRLDTAYIESDTLRLLVLDVNADTTLETINVPLVFPDVLEVALASPLPSVGVSGSTLIKTIDANDNVALYFSDGEDWLGGYEIPGVKNLDSIMLAPGEVKAIHLGQSGATTGQVYKWNGTAWAPANDISLYNTNGTLTANRTVDLDDKYLQMVGSAGGGDLTSVYKFSPSEFSIVQQYEAGGSTDYYNSISYDLNGIKMQRRNADDESFYFNIEDDGFEISSTQADFAGLRYALEYPDILENPRSIPDVGLVNELISDSLANVPIGALGVGFTDGGGSGTIPGGTTIQVQTGGDFVLDLSAPMADGYICAIGDVSTGVGLNMTGTSFQLSAGDAAISCFSDGGSGEFTMQAASAAISITPGYAKIILTNDAPFTIDDQRTIKKGLEYDADYSADIAANDRSIPDVGTVNEMITDLLPTVSPDSTFQKLVGRAVAGYDGKRSTQKMYREGNVIIGKNIHTNTTTLDTTGVLVLYPRTTSDAGGRQNLITTNTFENAVIENINGGGVIELKSPNGTEINGYSFKLRFPSNDVYEFRYTSSTGTTDFFNVTDGTAPFRIHKNLPENWLVGRSDGKTTLGGLEAGISTLNIGSSTAVTIPLISINNTEGGTQIFNSTNAPLGSINGSFGDISLSNVGAYINTANSGSASWSKLQSVFFNQTADKNVSNTTTETNLFGTGLGGTTLNNGFFIAGRTLRIRASGYFSNDSAGGNLTIKVKLGSTTIATKVTTAMVSGAANDYFDIDLTVVCRTAGTSAPFVVSGLITYQGTSGLFSDMISTTTTPTVVGSTNQNLALTLTGQWDTADTDKSVTITQSSVEILY